MIPTCFFAGWPDAGPCDGRLIRAHLIPRQKIKQYAPISVFQTSQEQRHELQQWIDDPRGWVPCCGGITGCSGHHGQLDHSRKLRIPRDKLPPAIEDFAAELGLTWYLDREYGLLNEGEPRGARGEGKRHGALGAVERSDPEAIGRG